jgi:FtsH-binding integral membrane protein
MTEIQKLMLSMFLHLRLGVGIIGLSLPLVLVFGGKVMGVSFAGSMSAYYHATSQCSLPQCPAATKDSSCQESGRGPMRNWFVGNLFFIGAAMFLMKGFSNWENWALNLAGLAAPCVALFPMEWPCRTPGFSTHSFHFPSAITFFVCAGFTCIFCSEKTLRQIPDPSPTDKKKIAVFRAVYRLLGIAMVALPVLAWIFAYNSGHLGFWLEMAGVSAFGTYWLVKTVELRWSQVEHKALMGLLEMNPRTLM